MPRRLILRLLALAALAAWSSTLPARADRLGGNYRGPDDTWVAREDAPAAPPGSGDAGGEEGGGGTPPAGGGGDTGGTDGTSPPAGEGEGGGSGDGDGETYRGPAGENPPPSDDRESGDGGGPSGPDGGGSPPDGGPPSDGGPPPDGGGGSSPDGGSSPGGGSAPPPPPGSAGDGGGVPAGGGSGAVRGRGAVPDDRDRIWPFYFEAAKEEYLATVARRRPVPRRSPPRSSTFQLSPLPEPQRTRREIGEGERNRARDLVTARLADPDSHVRDAAVIALGKGGGPGAVLLLERAAIRDPDYQVREDALLALGLTGNREEALPTLLYALEEPPRDPRERRAAFAALGLGLLGDRDGAAAPLLRRFREAAGRPDRPDDAACAAVALGMLGAADALPVLAKVAASRRVPEAVRSSVLHALGKFGAHPDGAVRREALAAIGAGLEARREPVRRAAVLALGSFDDPAAARRLSGGDGLGSPHPNVRNFAAHALGRIAGRMDPASPAFAEVARTLEEATGSERKDRWLYQAGNLALASIASAGRERVLLADLEEGAALRLHPHSASSVVLSLGLTGSGSPDVAAELDRVFRSRSSGAEVRAYAALGLAMAGAPSAAEGIAGVLTAQDGRPAADLARVAALSLGLVGGREESALLVDVLGGKRLEGLPGSARGFLLGAAVQGIGLIGDADAVEGLAPLLESREWERRAFAVAALGYLMEPDPAHRISPRLSEIFRHSDHTLRLPVVRAVQSSL